MLNPERVVNPEKGGTVNWQLRLNRRFGYDGWSMVAEYSANVADPAFTAMTRVVGYISCGLDLSGTLTGAGGVGGLVAQWRAGQGSEGSASTLWLPCYDGNGNVTEIVAAGAGTVGGQWEYSAFGETVTLDGAAAAAMPGRFSTKYTDGETGLVCYGYRYYAPETGRWLGRDPIGVRGGLKLYGMLGDDAVGRVDVLGYFPLFLAPTPRIMPPQLVDPNFFPPIIAPVPIPPTGGAIPPPTPTPIPAPEATPDPEPRIPREPRKGDCEVTSGFIGRNGKCIYDCSGMITRQLIVRWVKGSCAKVLGRGGWGRGFESQGECEKSCADGRNRITGGNTEW
jgi:RHS repeat-associated protein